MWLYGVRNPWRFSFDPSNGDLWIGDVGQDLIEEVDQLPSFLGRDAGKGANLGWNEMEGSKPYQGGTAPAGAIAAGVRLPPQRRQLLGDRRLRVPRRRRSRTSQGVYVFADYCVGDIRGLLARNAVRLDERSLGIPVAAGRSRRSARTPTARSTCSAPPGPIYRIEPA